MAETNVYTLYTEDKNREAIRLILNSHFVGYTMLPAFGAYKGTPENSLVITAWDTNRATVRSAARDIKTLNNQDAVSIKSEFVEIESI